jgi:type III secretion system FlhB-like substrate exporter
MTDTINDVAAEAAKEEPAVPALDEQGVAEQLVAQAREKGIELVGPNGLLSQLTKRVLETALEAEMSEHLGYDKHDPVGRNHGNSRNGVRSKTVLTEIGPVEIEVPRDLDASFSPDDCEEAAASADRSRPDRALPVRKRANHRGDLGALRRGLRRLGVAGDRLQDHRPGAGGDERLDEPAAG